MAVDVERSKIMELAASEEEADVPEVGKKVECGLDLVAAVPLFDLDQEDGAIASEGLCASAQDMQLVPFHVALDEVERLRKRRSDFVERRQRDRHVDRMVGALCLVAFERRERRDRLPIHDGDRERRFAARRRQSDGVKLEVAVTPSELPEPLVLIGIRFEHLDDAACAHDMAEVQRVQSAVSADVCDVKARLDEGPNGAKLAILAADEPVCPEQRCVSGRAQAVEGVA